MFDAIVSSPSLGLPLTCYDGVGESLSANLSLENQRNPTRNEVQGDMHDANGPKSLCVVRTTCHEGEDPSKTNIAQIFSSVDQAGENPVIVGVHMGTKAKLGAVTSLVEKSHK